LRGQARPNLEIFDKEISGQLERIFYKPDLRRDVQFIFWVRSLNNKEEEVKFIVSVIKKTAERMKIRAGFSEQTTSTDSVYNAFRIDIKEMGTKYPGFASNKFLGDKFVNRNLYAKIEVKSGAASYFYDDTDSITVNYSGKVDLTEIENIESSDYKFTQAIAPAVSTFEEIVFPVSIIALSVITAVLFFSIRSK